MGKFYINCKFCGEKVFKSREYCPLCHMEFMGQVSDNSEIASIPNPERLKKVISERISMTDGSFDYKSFDNELRMNKFDIEQWNSRSHFKTGVMQNIYFLISMYSLILIFIFFSMDVGLSGIKLIVFLSLLIVGSFLMIPFRKIVFKKSLSFNGDYILYEKPSRYNSERYEIEYKDLEKIELIIDNENSPVNIIFTAKENADIMARVFNLPVEEFYKKDNMIQYILLLSLKNNFNLYIKNKNSKKLFADDEKILTDNMESELLKQRQEEKLYVRIDYKNSVLPLTDEAFQEHLNYLKKISEDRFFMGGGFEDSSGGMIVFSAKGIEEANKIAENDPIILNGVYKYEIKEWKIVLKG